MLGMMVIEAKNERIIQGDEVKLFKESDIKY